MNSKYIKELRENASQLPEEKRVAVLGVIDRLEVLLSDINGTGGGFEAFQAVAEFSAAISHIHAIISYTKLKDELCQDVKVSDKCTTEKNNLIDGYSLKLGHGDVVVVKYQNEIDVDEPSDEELRNMLDAMDGL